MAYSGLRIQREVSMRSLSYKKVSLGLGDPTRRHGTPEGSGHLGTPKQPGHFSGLSQGDSTAAFLTFPQGGLQPWWLKHQL